MAIVIIDGEIHILCPICKKPQRFGTALRHMDQRHKGWDR